MFDEEARGPLKRLQHFLHAYPTTVPFIVLLLGVALFSTVVGGQFFHPFNLSLILQQVTIIGIVGIAQTLIILTAGIDLSVGAIMVLSSVVMGRLAVLAGVPVPTRLPARPAHRPRLRPDQRRRWSPGCGCRRSSSRSAPGASSAP